MDTSAAQRNVDPSQPQNQQGNDDLQKKELEEQLAIFDILSRNYRNVYQANLNEGTAKILKVATDYDLEEVVSMKGKVFPYEAILGRWIDYRVHEEDRERLRHQLSVENLRKVLAGKETEYSGTYRSIDGGVMHNYQFYVAKMDDDGNVIAGFQFIDHIIEEHLAQERELREKEEAYQRKLIAAKQEAERANNAKTDFLLRMSHDIRTPLNGIIGLLKINKTHADDTELVRANQEKMSIAANHLLSLINDVLQMSKLDDDAIELAHEPCDLNEVSRTISTMLTAKVEQEGQTMKIGEMDLPVRYVLTSPLHLRQIFLNIYSNCVKYNKPGGSVTTSVECLRNDGEHVEYRWTISDTGIGMSPEFLERIFEPFVQENAPAARTSYQGTGLGMSIVKKLVDKMGGTIEVSSVEGSGSTFVVTIPFEVADAPQAESAQPEDGTGSIKGLRLLLAEDNELNTEVAKTLLEDQGATVLTARDGAQALKAFQESPVGSIDAILMDVMMPTMNGIESAHAIRACSRPDAASIPIIAMTANAFVEDEQRCLAAGMNAHLPKPIDIAQVVSVVSRCVGERR